MKQILILTGKIQTGKSQAVYHWVTENPCGGFLTITKNNKKVFYNINDKEISTYEVDASSVNTISVGKYYLNRNAFIKAKEILNSSIIESKKWFVMDEIGKLEMNNEGHHLLFTEVLSSWKQNILLVVRDTLVDEVIKKYNLKTNQFRIISKEELKNI